MWYWFAVLSLPVFDCEFKLFMVSINWQLGTNTSFAWIALQKIEPVLAYSRKT